MTAGCARNLPPAVAQNSRASATTSAVGMSSHLDLCMPSHRIVCAGRGCGLLSAEPAPSKHTENMHGRSVPYLVATAAAAAHQCQCCHESSHVLWACICLLVHKGVDCQPVEGLSIQLAEGGAGEQLTAGRGGLVLRMGHKAQAHGQ